MHSWDTHTGYRKGGLKACLMVSKNILAVDYARNWIAMKKVSIRGKPGSVRLRGSRVNRCCVKIHRLTLFNSLKPASAATVAKYRSSQVVVFLFGDPLLWASVKHRSLHPCLESLYEPHPWHHVWNFRCLFFSWFSFLFSSRETDRRHERSGGYFGLISFSGHLCPLLVVPSHRDAAFLSCTLLIQTMFPRLLFGFWYQWCEITGAKNMLLSAEKKIANHWIHPVDYMCVHLLSSPPPLFPLLLLCLFYHPPDSSWKVFAFDPVLFGIFDWKAFTSETSIRRYACVCMLCMLWELAALPVTHHTHT